MVFVHGDDEPLVEQGGAGDARPVDRTRDDEIARSLLKLVPQRGRFALGDAEFDQRTVLVPVGFHGGWQVERSYSADGPHLDDAGNHALASFDLAHALLDFS